MEDEFIVALDLADLAGELGYLVEGPFATVADGIRALEAMRPDAAILDVQLADGEVYPVADRLAALGVPIIFHSGHADAATLCARYPEARCAGKPCGTDHLIRLLVELTTPQ